MILIPWWRFLEIKEDSITGETNSISQRKRITMKKTNILCTNNLNIIGGHTEKLFNENQGHFTPIFTSMTTAFWIFSVTNLDLCFCQLILLFVLNRNKSYSVAIEF
jgi:hypothetical protein